MNIEYIHEMFSIFSDMGFLASPGLEAVPHSEQGSAAGGATLSFSANLGPGFRI